MTTTSITDIICKIVERETACTRHEVVDRAYQESNITTGVYQALDALETQKRLGSKIEAIQSTHPKDVTSYYSAKTSTTVIQQIIDEKKELLRQHYNNSKDIGDHGEDMVKVVVDQLRYTEVEARKHSNNGIGITNHDIDVFAKHPSTKYYQGISVKNKREWIGQSDIAEIIGIVDEARSKWKKDIRPAIVGVYASDTIIQYALANDVLIATYNKQIMPTRCRDLYVEMKNRLAFDVEIADTPTQVMEYKITQYVCNAPYKIDQQTTKP